MIPTIFKKLPVGLFWMLWLGWTLLLCFLMLSPSDGTVHTVSSWFGGTEITDAIGHVILVSVDCVLFYGVLVRYLSAKNSLIVAGIVTLVFAIMLELAQTFIPSRGASLIDIIAAFVGVGCGLLISTRMPLGIEGGNIAK